MRPALRHWFIVVSVLVVGIVAALGALVARIKWANSTPARPKDMPATAIWIPAPPAPLDLIPRGYWLGCWLDDVRNVDRCKLTDFSGKVNFAADYSPLTGPSPVPMDRLRFKLMDSEMLWAPAGQDLVPIARLEDGTILVPTRNLTELRTRLLSSGADQTH